MLTYPAFRRMSSFALLKEGTAWHDAASGLLLSFEVVAGCQGSASDVGGGGSPGLPIHNHSALNFFGFRGEWPGQEAFVRGDYTGDSLPLPAGVTGGGPGINAGHT